jgi:hypothetical protein
LSADRDSTNGHHVVIVDALSSGRLLAPEFTRRGVPAVSVRSVPGMTKQYAFHREHFVADACLGGEPVPAGEACADDALGTLVRWVGAYRPMAVIPGAEVGVWLADILAGRFTPTLANDPGLGQARRDKEAMQQAVAAAGLTHIRTVGGASQAEIGSRLAAAGLIGRDLVVKAAASAGTDGTELVPEGRGWQEAWQRLIGRKNALWLRNDRVVIQEFIAGPEYVVNTVSHAGQHCLTGVMHSVKRPPGRHFAQYDRLDFLDPEDALVDVLFDYARAVLDALGIRHGAAHTEIILGPDGPCLVETGARLHGGMQPPICRIATGTSQVEELATLYLGGRPASRYRLLRHTSKVFIVTAGSGRLADRQPLERIRDLPSFQSIEFEQDPDAAVVETHDAFSVLAVVVLAHPERAQVDRDIVAIRAIEDGLRYLGTGHAASVLDP